MVRSGHPGRGVPTVFTVGNGLRAVPQNARKRPPHSGESARFSHLSFRGAQPRGNLLEESRKPYEIPGDCHVGLCPPRNDVETRAWSFCCRCGSGHPGRGVPTGFYFGSFAALGTSYSSHRRAVGLRPPPTIHGGDWDDRKGRPYGWSLNPSSPALKTGLPRGSGSMSHDFRPALSSGWCGPGRRP